MGRSAQSFEFRSPLKPRRKSRFADPKGLRQPAASVPRIAELRSDAMKGAAPIE